MISMVKKLVKRKEQITEQIWGIDGNVIGKTYRENLQFEIGWWRPNKRRIQSRWSEEVANQFRRRLWTEKRWQPPLLQLKLPAYKQRMVGCMLSSFQLKEFINRVLILVRSFYGIWKWRSVFHLFIYDGKVSWVLFFLFAIFGEWAGGFELQSLNRETWAVNFGEKSVSFGLWRMAGNHIAALLGWALAHKMPH